MCERNEQLLVAPVSTGDVDAALDVFGTKVFMKSGKRLGELRQTLREREDLSYLFPVRIDVKL